MKEMNLIQKLRHFSRHSAVLRKRLPILPRVLSGYYKTLVLGQNALRTIELTVTPYCNVNCKMCYATKLIDRKRKILKPKNYYNIYIPKNQY